MKYSDILYNIVYVLHIHVFYCIADIIHRYIVLYCIVEIIPNKYPTNELLRRNKVGDSLVDKIPDTLMPRGAATWQGKLSDE